MRIPLDRENGVPLYSQIQQFLRQQIQSGALAPATRLPASRELAGRLGVSRMTIVNAYAELEAEGLVCSRHGSGTFVAAPLETVRENGQPTAETQWPLWQQELAGRAAVSFREKYEAQLDPAANPGLIDFTAGMGATELFSLDDFRKCFQTVLRRDGAAALGYGENSQGGYQPLRTTIAQILSSEGIPTHADDVLITSGSQQALALVAGLLLRPGDRVLVESPTYEGAMDLFQSLGARLVPVPVDGEGMQMEALETALRTAHPRFIYTIPTFHNPTGVSLSTPRRRQLVALARHYNVPILEDDFAGDLRYEGHTQPALRALDSGGNVIYTNTFSKVLVPGLRIGFLVASGPVYKQLLAHKRNHDRATSDLMQRALEAYITVGRYQAHLRRICRVYRQRRNAMLSALARHMPAGVRWETPPGGLFIWVELPPHLAADTLVPGALQAGVAFSPGSSFFPDKEPRPALRLNFTVHEPVVIAEGIRRLAQVTAYAIRNTPYATQTTHPPKP